MSAEENNITQCFHCGNRTIHKRQKLVTVIEKIRSGDDDKEWDYKVYYTLWQCATCGDVSLYYVNETDVSGDPDEKYFDVATLAYPYNRQLQDDVPEIVRRGYAETQKVKKVSHHAFAVLARRTLEQICVERSVKGRSLNDKLSDLAKSNIIPHNLVRMADALRFLGNLGAHATDYEFDWEEINAIDDFLVAVIEYVYVAPAKVQRLSESIHKKQSQQKMAVIV